MKNTLKGRTLALAALVCGFGLAIASPARADWDDHGGHHPAWHARSWHDHERFVVHERPIYRGPHYVYAPPTTVYYPPPQPMGINLILPLHFD